MQVDRISNNSFTARSSEIRFADNIARRVNQICPRLSATKFEGFVHSNEFERNINVLRDGVKKMRDELFFDMLNAQGGYLAKCLAFVDRIKKSKVGNCHESANLAEIAAKTNGIRNCFVAQIKPQTGRMTDTHDHAVLYVDSFKRPYIIDAWLGFADYVPNAMERYRKEYSNFFDFEKFGTEKMYFDMLQTKTPVNGDAILALQKHLPDFVIEE